MTLAQKVAARTRTLNTCIRCRSIKKKCSGCNFRSKCVACFRSGATCVPCPPRRGSSTSSSSTSMSDHMPLLQIHEIVDILENPRNEPTEVYQIEEAFDGHVVWEDEAAPDEVYFIEKYKHQEPRIWRAKPIQIPEHPHLLHHRTGVRALSKTDLAIRLLWLTLSGSSDERDTFAHIVESQLTGSNVASISAHSIHWLRASFDESHLDEDLPTRPISSLNRSHYDPGDSEYLYASPLYADTITQSPVETFEEFE